MGSRRSGGHGQSAVDDRAAEALENALRDLAFENEGMKRRRPTWAGKRVDIVDTLQQRGPVDAAEREACQFRSDGGLCSRR
jgi:hypothetical protein